MRHNNFYSKDLIFDRPKKKERISSLASSWLSATVMDFSSQSERSSPTQPAPYGKLAPLTDTIQHHDGDHAWWTPVQQVLIQQILQVLFQQGLIQQVLF